MHRRRKGVPSQGAAHFHFIFSCLFFFFFPPDYLEFAPFGSKNGTLALAFLYFFHIFLDMESLSQAAFSVMLWE